MWRLRSLRLRISLIYPLVGGLCLVGMVTLAVGYAINYPFLHQTLNDKLISEADATASRIQMGIRNEVNELSHIMRLFWEEDTDLARSMLNARTAGKTDGIGRYMEKLDLFFMTMNLDFLIVTDDQGQVLYSTAQHLITGDIYRSPALTRVLGGSWSQFTTRLDKRWVVKVMTPLVFDGQVAGSVIAGLRVEKGLKREVESIIGDKLLFATLDSSIRGAFDWDSWIRLNTATVRKTISEGISYTTLNEESNQGWHYAPIRISNETFCLVVPLDMNVNHKILSEIQWRLGYSTVALLVLLGMLGFMIDGLLLRPMRRLEGKALALTDRCAGEGLGFSSVGESPRNEIQMVEQGFDVAAHAVVKYIRVLHQERQDLEDLALRDALTGLGNRRMFEQKLAHVLRRHRRVGERTFAILYMDLDRFKPINDTFGHDVGDMLLKEVAERFQEALRETDTVFRLGGDEFAALLPECGSSEEALFISRRVNTDIAQPYAIDDHICTIGVSIGIAIFPHHGETMESLLKSADVALYAAKDSGRGAARISSRVA
ncbi:MAG: GGDEF domain-containing protein [Magnetococcales bacterium]|nr:GGDEF domain-containing protein [Magnetococcales bacterium]